MPLMRRIPKRGFTNKFKKEFEIVNIGSLNIFENNYSVDAQALLEKGLVKNNKKGIKILGRGELSKSLTVKAHRFSEGATEAIKKAGGKIEIA